jgi:hypothetical protein
MVIFGRRLSNDCYDMLNGPGTQPQWAALRVSKTKAPDQPERSAAGGVAPFVTNVTIDSDVLRGGFHLKAATPPVPLEDRMAIVDLIARYAWALDTGDVESLVACFTADAVVIEDVFEDADRWVGHECVRRLGEHYRDSAGFAGRQHHVSQSVFAGQGSAYSVKSFAFVTECRGEPPFTLRFTGYYEDKVENRDGVWLFKERVIRLWDGEVLQRFPGRGARAPRKRPPELLVRKG